MNEDLIKNRLFQGIEKSGLDRMLVCSKTSRRIYHAGERIFCEGDEPANLYLLLSGKVALVKNFLSGKKSILFEVEKNDVFGEDILSEDITSYRYDAEVLTTSEILAVPWKFFYCFCDSACDHHQKLVRNMLTILTAKNSQIVQRLSILNIFSLRSRIAVWILDHCDDKKVVKLTMGREDLASFLGTTRPSLSRELMRMQAEGLIQAEKKEIRILDEDGLEELYE